MSSRSIWLAHTNEIIQHFEDRFKRALALIKAVVAEDALGPVEAVEVGAD